MNVLFVHDHKFKKNNSRYFSEGKITDDVLSRYLGSTENILIVSRMEDMSDVSQLSQIKLSNIKFTPVKGLVFSKIFSN